MFTPDFITNPYKTYTQLRTSAPLHWADKFRTGAWLVPRYADVLAGLHDSRLSSQRSHTLTAALPGEVQREFSTFNQIFSKWMLFLDPPQHSRLRKLLNKGMPLSFGHGTHFCIGAALAYAEAEIGFATLLERTSSLRMLNEVPAWRPNLTFRGLSSLRLSLSMQ